jgi:hypothetical protein
MRGAKTARSTSLLPRLCSWKRAGIDRRLRGTGSIDAAVTYLPGHGGVIEWRPGWMVVVLLHSTLAGRAAE